MVLSIVLMDEQNYWYGARYGHNPSRWPNIIINLLFRALNRYRLFIEVYQCYIV